MPDLSSPDGYQGIRPQKKSLPKKEDETPVVHDGNDPGLSSGALSPEKKENHGPLDDRG